MEFCLIITGNKYFLSHFETLVSTPRSRKLQFYNLFIGIILAKYPQIKYLSKLSNIDEFTLLKE